MGNDKSILEKITDTVKGHRDHRRGRRQSRAEDRRASIEGG
jgi:hypothetical protein